MISIVQKTAARLVEIVLPNTTAAAGCPPDCGCESKYFDGHWQNRTCCYNLGCKYFCGAWRPGAC